MLEAILWLGHLLVERVVKFHAKGGAIGDCSDNITVELLPKAKKSRKQKNN